MAILDKQRNEVHRYQEFVDKYTEIIELAYEAKQSFPELFASSQDYSLDPDDQPTPSTGITDTDLMELGVNYTAIATFINQAATNIINFHEGNAVGTREYGKDIRAIRI